MKYQVFDTGKPADCNHHEVDKSWNKSIFETYEEALTYVRKWLYPYGQAQEFPVNTPVCYAGYKEFYMEIKEIS